MGIKGIKRKAIILLALLISLSMLLAACGTSSKVSDIITVSGSTSIQPLAQDLADIFNESYPDVSVEIQGGGSSQGIKDVSAGISDIGTASRDLKEEEKPDITEHIIAYDGIAVVIHPANEISDLTQEQVSQIFKGEITNWKDVGGANQEILVVTREDGSGTRSAFQEMLKLEEKKDDKTVSLMKSDALVADGNGPVKANISSKENAIGYLSLGYVDDTIKKISVDGVECSVESIKDKSYKIARPFLMVTKGELRPEVQTFLDFILADEGQQVVSSSYITVN